jgi:hypothetical protein
MSSKIYLYRRKGNSEWATCDQSRFVELSSHKLFDTKTCLEAPPELAELQATIDRLTAENADIQQRLAEACEFIDAPYDKEKLQALIAECRYGVSGKGPAIEVANDLLNDCCDNLESLLKDNERLKGGQGEPVACTSCDGSGEYIDAIGDWRGYCSCPAGIALKNKPVPTSVAPDGWRLVPLHPTMDMLDALMEWNKVGNVNAYNNILNAAPVCLEKVKELN